MNLEFFVDGLRLVVVDGLEVPCEVMVTIKGGVANHLLLTQHEKLLNELCIEPKERRNRLEIPFSAD